MVGTPGFNARKVVLSIWWDWKESVCHKLLPSNQMVASEFYCQQSEIRERDSKKAPGREDAWPGQIWQSFARKFRSIHHSTQTLHSLTTFCFDLSRILLMVIVKGLWKPLRTVFLPESPHVLQYGIVVLPQKWQMFIEQNEAYLAQTKIVRIKKSVLEDCLILAFPTANIYSEKNWAAVSTDSMENSAQFVIATFRIRCKSESRVGTKFVKQNRLALTSSTWNTINRPYWIFVSSNGVRRVRIEVTKERDLISLVKTRLHGEWHEITHIDIFFIFTKNSEFSDLCLTC